MPGANTLFLKENSRWWTGPPAAPQALTRAKDAGLLPVLLVLAAVLFNAGLAIINAHVMPLSAGVVIAAEVMIVATAHAVILTHYRPQMLAWYAMIVVVVLFAIERAIVVGHFDPKFMRDVLLIPTFVLLGMTTPKHRLTPLVVVLHLVVVAGVLFEAFATEAFTSLFNVRDYYVATRPFAEADFWNSNSELFVSATRPEARFFSFVDFHRISSVFLEPVSLGNYVVIVTAFICANYRSMSLAVRAFLILGTIIALIGCDGRLAAVCSALVVVAAFVAPYLPRRSALLYFPLALIGALVVVWTLNPTSGEDNFTGRIAYGVDLLGRYGFWDWFGASNRYIGLAADSGIAYTIATQSIVGVVAFWLFLVLSAEERTVSQIRYLHALCLYLALTMLVSYSLFSIKTAALLWFIHGSLQMASAPRVARAPRAGVNVHASGFPRALGPRPL